MNNEKSPANTLMHFSTAQGETTPGYGWIETVPAVQAAMLNVSAWLIILYLPVVYICPGDF